MDTFKLEAIGLGELQKIIIGFEYGTSWPLEKVTIRESDDAREEYVFNCPRYRNIYLNQSYLSFKFEKFDSYTTNISITCNHS